MTYCDRADIESIYGANNVLQWSDLDNTADDAKVAARIDDVIADATDIINTRMRGGRYPVPLVDREGATPRIIRRACASLAGCLLYEARGSQDIDPNTGQPINKYRGRHAAVEKLLEDLSSGFANLDADAETPQPPVVVPDPPGYDPEHAAFHRGPYSL